MRGWSLEVEKGSNVSSSNVRKKFFREVHKKLFNYQLVLFHFSSRAKQKQQKLWVLNELPVTYHFRSVERRTVKEFNEEIRFHFKT